MALQVVNIVVVDSQPVPDPVENMTIRILLPDDITIVTEGVTGPAGELSLLLDDVNPSYLMRFYKLGYAVPQPQTFNMQAPYPMTLDVVATAPTRSTATDPKMCRVTGTLVDPYGRPPRQRYVHTRPVRDPNSFQVVPQMLLVDGADIVSDEQGRVVFDLFRCSLYDIQVPGWIDTPLTIEVPDADSIDLVDLVFPTPTTAGLADDDPVPPLTVGVGDIETIHPTVLLSNGLWLSDNRMGYDTAFLTARSDDESIVTVSRDSFSAGSALNLTGVATGVTDIIIGVDRVHEYFAARVPPHTFTEVAIQVFVVL